MKTAQFLVTLKKKKLRFDNMQNDSTHEQIIACIQIPSGYKIVSTCYGVRQIDDILHFNLSGVLRDNLH